MRCRGTLLLVALALCACERKPAAAPVTGLWHERADDRGCSGLPGDHRWFASVDLPEARHASWAIERWWAVEREKLVYVFFVTLQQDESIYFKGNTWSLRDDPERSIAALRLELQKLVRHVPRVGTPPTPNAQLFLRVDASPRWKVLRRLLEFASTAGVGPGTKFAVTGWENWAAACNGFLAGEWRSASEPVPAVTVLPVAIERTVEGGRVVTRLRAGERSWEFPRHETGGAVAVPFRGADLAAANRIWDEFEAHLAASRGLGFRTADLRVGDDVPWAYVVAVLDAAVGARVFDVRLGDDLALRFAAPEGPPITFRPGDPEPRDWSTGLALSIGAAAAGLTFAVGGFPRRKRVQPKPA